VNPKNPFFVLELPSAATPGEIERAGRKLIGLLEVGSEKAAKYTCSFGTFDRDTTAIREAMAELRDPEKRARHAMLASLLAVEEMAASEEAIDAPLPDAFALAGYPGL
jgi:curved DNA-binding protein CbpA